jgi:hypothetical protein
MFSRGRSRRRGLIALATGMLAALTACTQGNIVSDFQRPTYMVIDTLAGGVEIRRYDHLALRGERAADRSVEGSPAEIEAAAAESGLVAVLTSSIGEPEAGQQALLAALEASPRWQADGEPARRTGDSRWTLFGFDQTEVVVPIQRTSELSS